MCVGRGTLLLSYAMGTESESLAKWSSPPMISFVLSLKATQSSLALMLGISFLPQVSPAFAEANVHSAKSWAES